MDPETIDLPLVTREATVTVVEGATRELEVVFTTGAPVRRLDRRGIYTEVLMVTPEAVNLEERFATGAAPVLDTHSNWSLSSQLGVVVSARVENGLGYARLRLNPTGETEDRLWAALQSGQRRPVSAGYRYDEIAETIDETTGARTITALRWTPMEISFVPIPADPGALTRADTQLYPCRVVPAQPKRTQTMPDNPIDDAAEASRERTRIARITAAYDLAVRAAPGVDFTQLRDECVANRSMTEATFGAAAALIMPPVPNDAAAAERRRAATITDLATQHGMTDRARGWIEAGVTVDTVRAEILDQVATRQEQTGPRATVTRDEGETMRRGIEGAFAHRVGATTELDDNARRFRGHNVLQLMADFVGHRGHVTAWNREDIMARALHVTSDFPNLLGGGVRRALLAAYATAPATYQRIATRQDLSDFRPVDMLNASSLPNLMPVPEGGELKFGTLAESRERMALMTYGRALGMSRQAIVNDDLGAFQRAISGIGRKAAGLENQLVYALLQSNSGAGPTMLTDSVAMFSTAGTRGNLAASGGALDATTLDAARVALRRVKGVATRGETPDDLTISPRVLLVGPTRETAARQLVSLAVVPGTTAAVNVFAGTLDVVVEAQIASNAFYLFADPADVPVLAYGYLQGAEGPTVRRGERMGLDGLQWDFIHDFGCAAIDWRGAFRNPGN